MIAALKSVWKSKLGKGGISAAVWGIFFFLDLPGRIQAVREWAPRLPPFLSTVVSFSLSQTGSLVIFVIGIVLVLAALRRQSHALARVRVEAPERRVATPALSTQPRSPGPERVFVDRSVTPESLTKFFKDNTHVQARKLVAPVIGKWMQLSGLLGEVISSTGDHAQLTFGRVDGVDYLLVFMYFNGKEQVDELSMLSRGASLTVRGQIRDVSAVDFHLDNCELVR